MNRPRSYAIAAAMLAAYCAVSLFFTIPSLARGADAPPEEPPFFILVISFTLTILGFVAAYGAWRVQKWAVVLAVAVGGITILTGELPAIIFAPSLALRLSGVVSVAWLATMIALLLRPTGVGQRAVREGPPQGGHPVTATLE